MHTAQVTAHINTVPAELLLIIFKLVYMKSRRSTSHPLIHSTRNSQPPPYRTEWPNDDDLLSRSLFPYALASVCPLWRNVLLSFPLFWTRLVIFVDESPTPLSDVQHYLNLTVGLPLEVTITRRDKTSTNSDPNERSRVEAVMALIGPHVHRCQTLSFDVIQRSSLPLIGKDFYGEAPHLKELKLNCEVDDGADDSILESPEGREEFSCPRLRDLALDGRNFQWFFEGGSERIKKLSTVRRLKISHFAPTKTRRGRIPAITGLYEVLLAIPGLLFLQITNVDFSRDDVDVNEMQSLDRPLLTINLEDLRHDVADIILRLMDSIEWLTIKRCPLDSIYNVPNLWYLTLQDISPTDDLTSFLARGETNTLYLEACLGLDDEALRKITTEDEGLKHLHLRDCNNFSIAALKELVQKRMEVLPTVVLYGEFGPMESITSSGIGPAISVEDAAWFHKNLKFFHWHSTQPDGSISTSYN